MVREKRIYQLWERSPRPLSWRTLWSRHRFAVLLCISIGSAIVLGGYASLPAFHILATLVLMDVITLRNASRWGGHQVTVLVLVHAFGVLTMVVGSRFVQETTVGIYLLFLVLLLFFPRQEKGGF
jgi:hypothetical protein